MQTSAWTSSLGVPASTLFSFLVVLCRVGSAFVFIGIPGVKSIPSMSRIAFLVILSASLATVIPTQSPLPVSGGHWLQLVMSEVTFGLAVGVAVGFIGEILSFSMQSLALQAGYSYATSIDPTSEADSGILPIIAQVASNLLFFSFDVHLHVLRAFAFSFEHWPPGGPKLSVESGNALIALGGSMMGLAVGLALPVIGLLLLTDVSMALLSRMQTQLQLLSVSFPLKMLAALVLLVATVPMFSRIYERGLHMAAGTLTVLLKR